MAIDNFKPTIWSREILYSLKKSLVGMNITNQNYTGDISQQGDTVNIITPGAINTGDYDGTEITFQDITAASQQLNIDQAKYVAMTVDDVDEAQSNVRLMQTYMTEAQYALSDATDEYIFSLYTDADASNVIAAEALTVENIYSKVVEAKKRLSLNNVPKMGRYIVFSPDEVALLEDSPQFTSASDLGDETKRTGFAGRIAGFEVYESNSTSEANDGTDDVRHLPYGQMQAITFANQILNMEAGRHEKLFADFVKGLHVYGAKVVRPTAFGDLRAIV